MAEDLGWSTGKVAMADKVWSKADDEIKLRAERRMGEMLKEIELNKGAITPGTNRGTTQLHDVTSSPKREKLQNFQKGNIPRGYLAYFHDLFMQKRASAE
jgi:hypothetical protein